jgi:hypothetical protein
MDRLLDQQRQEQRKTSDGQKGEASHIVHGGFLRHGSCQGRVARPFPPSNNTANSFKCERSVE